MRNSAQQANAREPRQRCFSFRARPLRGIPPFAVLVPSDSFSVSGALSRVELVFFFCLYALFSASLTAGLRLANEGGGLGKLFSF